MELYLTISKVKLEFIWLVFFPSQSPQCSFSFRKQRISNGSCLSNVVNMLWKAEGRGGWKTIPTCEILDNKFINIDSHCWHVTLHLLNSRMRTDRDSYTITLVLFCKVQLWAFVFSSPSLPTFTISFLFLILFVPCSFLDIPLPSFHGAPRPPLCRSKFVKQDDRFSRIQLEINLYLW